MEYNNKAIGYRIKAMRKDQKMTQDELIDRLSEVFYPIGRNRISDIENGVIGGCNLDFLFALCKIFKCDVGYLLGEYNERLKETSEIHVKTGLTEAAINYLMACNLMGYSDSNLSSANSSYGNNIRTELKTINKLIESLSEGTKDEYGNEDESVISTITDFLYHDALVTDEAVLDICYPRIDEDGDTFNYTPSGEHGIVVHNKDLRSFFLLSVNRALNNLRDEIEREDYNGKRNKER